MGYSDWALIVATIAGPILAVQAQKWVERARERGNTKRWIIYTLMATRSARLSQEHVRALNSIEMAYYGVFLFGKRVERKKEKTVTDRWRTYLDHLNSKRPDAPGAEQTQWDDKTNDYFVNLLDALLQEHRFDFDLVDIKRGVYAPQGHFTSEMEGMALRRLAVEWLLGSRAVNIDVAAPQPQAAPPAQG